MLGKKKWISAIIFVLLTLSLLASTVKWEYTHATSADQDQWAQPFALLAIQSANILKFFRKMTNCLVQIERWTSPSFDIKLGKDWICTILSTCLISKIHGKVYARHDFNIPRSRKKRLLKIFYSIIWVVLIFHIPCKYTLVNSLYLLWRQKFEAFS
jgi:hypothetical protein